MGDGRPGAIPATRAGGDHRGTQEGRPEAPARALSLPGLRPAYGPRPRYTIDAKALQAIRDGLALIGAQQPIADPGDPTAPDQRAYVRGLEHARGLGACNGRAWGLLWDLARLAEPSEQPPLPPTCHCGARLEIDVREAEFSWKADALTAPAECPDCGSTYTVRTYIEAVALLREGEAEDDDLTERGERAKADNRAADDWRKD